MAQTRKRRRTKHRGNAAGMVEARGRTGRPPPEPRRRARSQDARPTGAATGWSTPPTWRSALNRAGIATVVFAILVLVLFKQSMAQAVLLAAVMLLLYVPLTYYTDLWIHRRYLRKQEQAKAKAGAALMDVRMLTVGPFAENSFIVRPEDGDRAVIVDPGDEAERLLARDRGDSASRLDAILLTHTHIDHIGAVAPVARATGAQVYCPRIEAPVLTNGEIFARWGMGTFEPYEADELLDGGERLELAGLDIEVLFTPGHSPGHVTYAIEERRRAVQRRRAVPGLGRPRRPAGRRRAHAAALDRRPARPFRRRDDGVSRAHGHHDARARTGHQPVPARSWSSRPMQAPPRANAYRDAWSGDLRADRRRQREVRVAGWVHRRRDHGGLIFIDLRDRVGPRPARLPPRDLGRGVRARRGAAARARPHRARRGRRARGRRTSTRTSRPARSRSQVVEAERLATAETPPFPLDEDVELDEMLRLRHRALDLRREPMQRAIALRHAVIQTMRRELEARDFLEIETPILTKSTPEGARDFLVPNRREPGTWYALPQSPQLFKQLLMIGGYERYYQIARCFRDEDMRADRQAEFTQLDVEMAFVDGGRRHRDARGGDGARSSRSPTSGCPSRPWPRMPYAEAIARFGTDRPDLRFGLELRDVSDARCAASEFKVFAVGPRRRRRRAGDQRRRARDVALGPRRPQRGRPAPRRQGGRVGVRRGRRRLALADREVLRRRRRSPRVDSAARGAPRATCCSSSPTERNGRARRSAGCALELAERFGLIPDDRHDILWIVDFPAFEPTDEGGWTAVHHPFTAPLGDLDGDPGALRSRAYDLILDGSELGGGSIRIHDTDVQQRVLELIGMDEEEAQARFGFLLDALRYGAPPHGGIAFGIDRIVAIMGGYDSIRDVIAFPKTASGLDPLTGAPAPIDERQLRELGLRLAREAASARLDLERAADELVELAGVGEAGDRPGAARAVDDEHRRRRDDRDAAGDRLVVGEPVERGDVLGDLAVAGVEAVDRGADRAVVGDLAVPEEEDDDLAGLDVGEDGLDRLGVDLAADRVEVDRAGLGGGLGRLAAVAGGGRPWRCRPRVSAASAAASCLAAASWEAPTACCACSAALPGALWAGRALGGRGWRSERVVRGRRLGPQGDEPQGGEGERRQEGDAHRKRDLAHDQHGRPLRHEVERRRAEDWTGGYIRPPVAASTRWWECSGQTMTHPSRSWPLRSSRGSLVAVLVAAAPAQAANWTCEGSAVRGTVLGAATIEPLTANKGAETCAPARAGLAGATAAFPLPLSLAALGAETTVENLDQPRRRRRSAPPAGSPTCASARCPSCRCSCRSRT